MARLFDIIILVLFLYLIIRGIMTGFLKSSISIIGLVAAWIGARTWGSFCAVLLQNKTPVGEMVHKVSAEYVNGIIDGYMITQGETALPLDAPAISLGQIDLTGFIDKLKQLLDPFHLFGGKLEGELTQSITDTVRKNVGTTVNDVLTDVKSTFTATMTDHVMHILGYVLVFVVILLAVKLIGVILFALTDSSDSLSFLNRLGGVGVGIVEGFVVTAVIILFLQALLVFHSDFATFLQDSMTYHIFQKALNSLIHLLYG